MLIPNKTQERKEKALQKLLRSESGLKTMANAIRKNLLAYYEAMRQEQIKNARMTRKDGTK